MVTRDEAKRAIRESVYDVGADCEQCGGTGTAYPGRRVVHSRRGGFGADWDEQDALNAIDNATELTRRKGFFGPVLVVTEQNGSHVAFDLQPETEEQ